MEKSYNVSIIGNGNVAWHLSKALERAGHNVIEVAGRDINKANEITERLFRTKARNTTDLSESKSEIFFLAVSDDAISDVVHTWSFPENCIIAHTSGNTSLDVLKTLKQEKGIFYPVQTFTKGREINFQKVPIVIESPSVPTEKILTEIAVSVSENIYYLNSERRKILHLAAVFASNFVNHMLAVSSNILEKENIPTELFNSLIQETVAKALEENPKNVQTGPAIRRDLGTINSHLEYLEKYPDFHNLYKSISDSIINFPR